MYKLILSLCLLVTPVLADNPDLIFKKSSTFRVLSPNDKLSVYGVDDPDVRLLGPLGIAAGVHNRREHDLTTIR